jgi:hypothetical protein
MILVDKPRASKILWYWIICSFFEEDCHTNLEAIVNRKALDIEYCTLLGRKNRGSDPIILAARRLSRDLWRRMLSPFILELLHGAHWPGKVSVGNCQPK